MKTLLVLAMTIMAQVTLHAALVQSYFTSNGPPVVGQQDLNKAFNWPVPTNTDVNPGNNIALELLFSNNIPGTNYLNLPIFTVEYENNGIGGANGDFGTVGTNVFWKNPASAYNCGGWFAHDLAIAPMGSATDNRVFIMRPKSWGIDTNTTASLGGETLFETFGGINNPDQQGGGYFNWLSADGYDGTVAVGQLSTYFSQIDISGAHFQGILTVVPDAHHVRPEFVLMPQLGLAISNSVGSIQYVGGTFYFTGPSTNFEGEITTNGFSGNGAGLTNLNASANALATTNGNNVWTGSNSFGPAVFGNMTVTMPITNGVFGFSNANNTLGGGHNYFGITNTGTAIFGRLAITNVPPGINIGAVFTLTNVSTGEGMWSNAAAGGSQTPWTSLINAAGFGVTNVLQVAANGGTAANPGLLFTNNANGVCGVYSDGSGQISFETGASHATLDRFGEFTFSGNTLIFNSATIGEAIGIDSTLPVNSRNMTWNNGANIFIVPYIQAGHTNCTTATSLQISFAVPMPSTNYTTVVNANNSAIATYFPSQKTTTGFIANFGSLTSADIDWQVTQHTQ